MMDSNRIMTGRRLLGSFAMLVIVAVVACSSVPPAIFIQGQPTSANELPTLSITEPIDNLTVSRGQRFVIRWTDTDGDSNAGINFSLVHSTTNVQTLLVEGIAENDLEGPDSFTVATSLIAEGDYFILGTIDDGVNLPVNEFAIVGGSGNTRVVLKVTKAGEGPPTVPPIVEVTEPAFNLSVAQDDVLLISVQPDLFDPTKPFDPDSQVKLWIVLDFDDDPLNDDPANPKVDESGLPLDVIVLEEVDLLAGEFAPRSITQVIDLARIPPRPAGEPYRIRATLDDQNNPRVHKYAPGTINVVQLASGIVDLGEAGKTVSGARFYGFNPGANVGSSMSTISDFDGDGVSDFMLVAQFGNPRNFGPVGEAYLIYGLDGRRFGGAIAVNSVSDVIDGVIFEGPPIRREPSVHGDERAITGTPASLGISDVSWIEDLGSDGRPEILVGLPLVYGAIDTTDFDPDDANVPPSGSTTTISMTIRRGEVGIDTDGDFIADEIDNDYQAVFDTTIRDDRPDEPAGDGDIRWLRDEDGDVPAIEWGLLKFVDVLDQIPDDQFAIDLSSVRAFLELVTSDPGVSGVLWRSLSDFNEQTTYNSYAQFPGPPTLGIDYDSAGNRGFGAGLGSINTELLGVLTTVDVTEVVRQLILGVLPAESRNEIRFIIVPGTNNGEDQTKVISSELTFGPTAFRPTLRIGYDRVISIGTVGCYPDDIANNRTDEATSDGTLNDAQFYAGGMAVVVHSSMRDNRPRVRINGLPDPRLHNTSIALELVGQRAGFLLDSEDINRERPEVFARADNVGIDPADRDGIDANPDRIPGARFVAGPYDHVDAGRLRQPPRAGRFGTSVAAIGDLNNDGVSEIVISAPRNERHLVTLLENFGERGTHRQSTRFRGSITIIPGANYNNDERWGDFGGASATTMLPRLDNSSGRCLGTPQRRLLSIAPDIIEVFAEALDDELGDGQSAGDFNLDGIADILCGAPLNNRDGEDDAETITRDTGATYVLYGRSVLNDFDLKNADDPILRTPMLRIRGVLPGDRIGWRQSKGLDVNGDRIDDVFISSPHADFGGILREECGVDFNGDGVFDENDLDSTRFTSCQFTTGSFVFSDDPCKAFDYDYDSDIDDDDRAVFDRLVNGDSDACENLVDNGFAAIIFGGVFTDGDRDINQIATSDLVGVRFFGSEAGHRAGFDVSSAGDFNQDGFGDILIAVPGEVRRDSAGRERLGVVYLVFGGTHLENTTWNLSVVGSPELPGMVILSPYLKGRPNEAPPESVALIGDINNDGFGDICIGLPKADFIDLSFPQGAEAPNDPSVGRRRDAGDAYIIYGNNFGSNRAVP